MTAEFTITECLPPAGAMTAGIGHVGADFVPDDMTPFDPTHPGKQYSKEGVVHVTVPVNFRNSAGERIDPPAGSEVTFVVTGEGAPAVLAPVSTWNCLPGRECLAYASFPATRAPASRNLYVTAQVVVDGQPMGRPKVEGAFLQGTEDISQVGTAGGGGFWQGGTLTATATCADAKTGTGEIAFTITQPRDWYYEISYDGTRIETPEQKSAPDPVTKWKAGFWPGGVTTRGISANYTVPVTAGSHEITVDGDWQDAKEWATLMKVSVEVKPCETTGGGTGGNPTGGGNTGGPTGGSTPSTTPVVKNGSPLTGTGAPGTGARGATAERANTIVAAGGIGTAALGLIAVAVLAYRRYRSA